MEHLKFVLFPPEGLSLLQTAFDPDRFGIRTTEFISVGVLKDVGHILIAPYPRAEMLL
jgi:hypothetical protein